MKYSSKLKKKIVKLIKGKYKNYSCVISSVSIFTRLFSRIKILQIGQISQINWSTKSYVAWRIWVSKICHLSSTLEMSKGVNRSENLRRRFIQFAQPSRLRQH